MCDIQVVINYFFLSLQYMPSVSRNVNGYVYMCVCVCVCQGARVGAISVVEIVGTDEYLCICVVMGVFVRARARLCVCVCVCVCSVCLCVCISLYLCLFVRLSARFMKIKMQCPGIIYYILHLPNSSN